MLILDHDGTGIYPSDDPHPNGWQRADTPVGWRIVDITGREWLAESYSDHGFVAKWSWRDLFRRRPRRFELHLTDKGLIPLEEFQALLSKAIDGRQRYWDDIMGSQEAKQLVARAKSVSKIVAAFYRIQGGP